MGMKKVLRNLKKPIEKVLNNMKFRHKFFVLYFSCVIIPLIVTDSIILNAVYRQEKSSVRYDMEYVAGIYQNFFLNTISNDITLANSVNMNKKINQVVEKYYTDEYDYFTAYFNLISDSFLETTSGQNRDSLVVYADNKSIVNSDFVKQLSREYTSKWYQDFIDSERKDYLCVYYDYDSVGSTISKRKFYYIKRLEYYRSDVAKIVVIGHDPTSLQGNLNALASTYPVYVTVGDYVLYSTENLNDIDVVQMKKVKSTDIVKTVSVAGTDINITVVNNTPIIASAIKNNFGVLILLLFITIIIPPIILKAIESSIVKRIDRLGNAFGNEQTNTFTEIKDIQGNDEIAFLMKKYNKMVDITNELITTVYKDKIKEQEIDIARQNAELLALQSQINPHFMFNALESIRMHSLLKGETETAIMVDQLAVMERQNVEWGSDFVTIKNEIESIEAYLGLQSYRFGDRLSYDIDVEEGCENYLVPKLTIVTFVENACVHGIESKSTQGWIFVRVYSDKKNLVIEVEDTGEGMDEDKVKEMLDDINNVSIETIKTKKHVGMLNACLRLKMVTEKTVQFDIESESGVGLSVIIRIPFERLDKSEGSL